MAAICSFLARRTHLDALRCTMHLVRAMRRPWQRCWMLKQTHASPMCVEVCAWGPLPDQAV